MQALLLGVESVIIAHTATIDKRMALALGLIEGPFVHVMLAGPMLRFDEAPVGQFPVPSARLRYGLQPRRPRGRGRARGRRRQRGWESRGQVNRWGLLGDWHNYRCRWFNCLGGRVGHDEDVEDTVLVLGVHREVDVQVVLG